MIFMNPSELFSISHLAEFAGTSLPTAMREVDRLTTERYGIPSIILMENAAHAVARVITEKLGGSVKGKSPWRSEYWRGYHHAQSKITFVAKHFGGHEASKKRYRLIGVTALALFIRLLVPSPKHIARMVGRFRGLINYQNPFQ